MPKFVKTIEVEVEYDYSADPPDPTVGAFEWQFYITAEKINGLPVGNIGNKLHDYLADAAENEIRDEYLNGEQ